MMFTEEEAKTKWCPMVQKRITALFTDGQPDQRIKAEVADREDKCIASHCMIWRREKDIYGDDYGKDIPDNRGYCGLGGTPLDSRLDGARRFL
jgi:hypothetical protein